MQEGPVFDAETLYLLLLLVERGAEEAALRERDTIVESDPRETEQQDDRRPPRHRLRLRSSKRLAWMFGALGVLSAVGMIVALYLLPLLTTAATVTIIPTVVPISATTSVQVETTGSANSALGQQHNQVPGRILSSLTLSQARSAPTTGTGYRPATAAHGHITFYNAEPAVQIVPAGTLLTGADGAQVVTDEQATLPPAVYPTFGQATVAAQATISGPAGDSEAGEIYGPCCRLNLSAVSSAFTGGQNARSYPMVTQAVTESAEKRLGTGYSLTGDVQITVTVAARSSRQDPLPVLQVIGMGTWSYQFNTAQLHYLAHLLPGKSKAQATHLLLSQPGVSQVAMTVSGGSSTFPTDAGNIRVLVLYQAV